MNWQRSLPILTLTLLGAILLAGCDSDDSAVGTQPTDDTGADSSLVSTTIGDRMMATPFQSLEISTQLLAQQGVTVLNARPGPLAATSAGDEDIIITAIGDYSYANGWHVFTFEAIVVNTNTGDTVDIAGVDSVQVLVNGSPVFVVDHNVVIDGVLARAHLDWSVRDGSGDGVVHHSIDVGATPIEADTLITIDGFAHDTLNGFEATDSVQCDVHLSYDMTIENLQVYASAGDDDCPEAGDITVAVSIDAGCAEIIGSNPDSVHVDGTWTVTAHVHDDGSVTVTYTNGLAYWRVTEDCGSGAEEAESWWTSAVTSEQPNR